jgi:hypothetical protein
VHPADFVIEGAEFRQVARPLVGKAAAEWREGRGREVVRDLGDDRHEREEGAPSHFRGIPPGRPLPRLQGPQSPRT